MEPSSKYSDKEVAAWNDAITECVRIVNANSKTGTHYRGMDYGKHYGMLDERQRSQLITAIKAIKMIAHE